MEDWTELKAFKCTRCGKLFHGGCPEMCTCRSPYEKDRIIGPFQIVGEKIGERVPVLCLLCDSTTELHYTALKRQKSCGCKPRWIVISDMTSKTVRYKCTKCQKTTLEELPVYQYCCEED